MGVNAPDDFAALQEDLRAVVPHVERLHVRKTEAPAPGPQGKAQPTYTLDLSFKGAGRVPAERASEGTLFALALLAALHGPDMPSLLLIDDIDHGLHLTAQFQVIKAIRAVMERRPALQVVATSHSPFLFEQVRGAEVRVMALNAEGHACVQPLTAHPEYDRWARSMSTGEVWANVGEAWVC
jgi:predicted ATPase